MTHRIWGARVRGAYGTAEAGTRTQYVQYVGPWGQAALRLRRYVHKAGAGTRSPYVPYGGRGEITSVRVSGARDRAEAERVAVEVPLEPLPHRGARGAK